MLAGMKVDKVSTSFPAEVGDEIRSAARRSGLSVSARLTEAARAKLRAEALREALDTYQREHSAFTPEELTRAGRDLGFVADTRPTAT
jgi:predicted nuclease with TOPRIM domain